VTVCAGVAKTPGDRVDAAPVQSPDGRRVALGEAAPLETAAWLVREDLALEERADVSASARVV